MAQIMTGLRDKSSKPQALAPKRGTGLVAKKAVAKKATAKTASAKKVLAQAAAKTAGKAASKKAAAKHARVLLMTDVMALGVPKPRTGQAAVDLAVRAGVIGPHGALKPRFR